MLTSYSFHKTTTNACHQKRLNFVCTGSCLEEDQIKQGISALISKREKSVHEQVGILQCQRCENGLGAMGPSRAYVHIR